MILISSFYALFATTVVALPSFQQLATPVQGRELGLSSLTRRAAHLFTDIWAGSFDNSPQGTLKSVTATIKIPTVKDIPHGSGADAWIGLDVMSCPATYLNAGFGFYNNTAMGLEYTAWIGPKPGAKNQLHDFKINQGDTLIITITTSTPTHATITFDNQSTGKSINKTLSLKTPLCLQDVAWILSSSRGPDAEPKPLPDFGTLTFSASSAKGVSGILTDPSRGQVLDIEQHGRALTHVIVSENTMTIQRVEG